MELENIVISLENAKKLKELGHKQESFFYYCYSKRTKKYWIYTKNQFDNYNKSEDLMTSDFSAYTTQELFEIAESENLHFNIYKNENEPGIKLYYSPEWGTDNSYTFSGDNIADLLAQMLIAKHEEDKNE